MCSKSRDEVAAETEEATASVRSMFALRCGHGLCRACLSQTARASLGSRLVPLRCCLRAVPQTLVRAVLDPEEAAFYSYLLAKAARLATESAPAAAAAASPAAGPSTRSQSKRKLARKASPSAKSCDRKVGVAPTKRTKKDTEAKTTTKANKRETKQKKSETTETETDMANETQEKEKDGAPACHSCQAVVANGRARFSAPCAHTLCRNCVIARCRLAVANDEAPGGVGVPVRCCGRVLPLALVRAAVPSSDFARYRKLLASFEAGARAFPRAGPARKKRRGPDAGEAVGAEAAKPEDAGRCVSCMEAAATPGELVTGPCGHAYCLSCFGYMARLSLQDRARVPVRCCGAEFPEEFVARVLPAAELAAYRRFLADKAPRESTLKSDREYAALVRKMRGKQCPTCGVGVLRTAGCAAMTCALGHVFCWACGRSVCSCAAQ